MEILAILVIVQFVVGIIKEQQFLKHIKDLELKLMTGDPEPRKDHPNEIVSEKKVFDITEIDPSRAVDAIKNKFKK